MASRKWLREVQGSTQTPGQEPAMVTSSAMGAQLTIYKCGISAHNLRASPKPWPFNLNDISLAHMPRWLLPEGLDRCHPMPCVWRKLRTLLHVCAIPGRCQEPRFRTGILSSLGARRCRMVDARDRFDRSTVLISASENAGTAWQRGPQGIHQQLATCISQPPREILRA